MEKSRKRIASNVRGMEENTLAILDSFCAYDSSHFHDDRLAFLEAVRSTAINGNAPTNKMMEAVFEILRGAKSLELIIVSYKLLIDLEKHFPRVYLADGNNVKSRELVVIEEAWSPFSVGSEVSINLNREADKRSKEPIDFAGFHMLIEGLAKVINEPPPSDKLLKILANMLLCEYLINVLEGDFLPRNQAFLQSSDWISLRDCMINKLLGSRRVNYKGLVKDCMFVLSKPFSAYALLNCDSGSAETSPPQVYNDSNAAITLSLPEIEKSTHNAVQKLLVMMTELDSSRKKADLEGVTTRTDGVVRTPVTELILDELSYDKDMISPFLQVITEPKLKLDIVSQYFEKYSAKPSTRKRTNGSQDDPTTTGFFKCFLNSASTKGIVKKIGANAVQVLLAHALQACMSLPREQMLEGISELHSATESNPLETICKSVISAFKRLRETDKHMEILPIGTEALFTAATILSSR